MANRQAVFGIAMLLVVAFSGAGCYLVAPHHHKKPLSPAQIAAEYFADWQSGDLTGMSVLVRDVPQDFAAQHYNLSSPLGVTSVAFSQSPLVMDDHAHAHVPFTVTRTLQQGTWSQPSTLKLSRQQGKWLVDWSPSTLYPGLTDGAIWKLVPVDGGSTVAVDQNGTTIPSSSTVQNYLPQIVSGSTGSGGSSATAIEFFVPGQPRGTIVKTFGQATAGKVRTTLDAKIQSAADDAVHAQSKSAAIVVVKPSTGGILAVADTLGSRDAFLGLYHVGSAFKIITASALVQAGLSPSSTVACPQKVLLGQRTIKNDDGVNLGSTTLQQAFAQSCNTTFSQLATDKLTPDKLSAAATLFGFNTHLDPGISAYSGDAINLTTGAEFAEDAIGDGKVQANPLDMATVAAAVEDGEWRPPHLLRDAQGGSSHSIPSAVLDALRPMMRAVVTDGTGKAAGFPSDVYGKTGTAEYDDKGNSHAWFVGYRGDMAFAVFVLGGESGPDVAAPMAARFLSSLGG
jgi:hypothetical protein